MRVPQTVEKPQESAREPQSFRTIIVVGGVYGDHGADFALQNRFLADFAAGMPALHLPLERHLPAPESEALNLCGAHAPARADLRAGQIVRIGTGHDGLNALQAADQLAAAGRIQFAHHIVQEQHRRFT